MKTHQQVHKTASSQQTPMPTSASFLQSRPFAPMTHPDVVEQQAAPVQEKSDRLYRFNDYCDRIVSRRQPLYPQPKLTLGRVGDKYEQEADRVAQQVMQRLNTLPTEPATHKLSIQRQEIREEELQMKPYPLSIQRQDVPEADTQLQRMPIIQRISGDAGMAVTDELEASIHQARGRGQPLIQRIRQPMEQAFGANFSGVKIHADAQSDLLSQSIQAKAFTTGADIFFRQGAYNPRSRGGQELIAHELTHVVQQNGSTVQQEVEAEAGKSAAEMNAVSQYQNYEQFGRSIQPRETIGRTKIMAKPLVHQAPMVIQRWSVTEINEATGSVAKEVTYGYIWDMRQPLKKPTKHLMPVVGATDPDTNFSALGEQFKDKQILYQLHASFARPFIAQQPQLFHITVQPDDNPQQKYKLSFEYGIDGKFISRRQEKIRNIHYEQTVYGFSTPTKFSEPEFDKGFIATLQDQADDIAGFINCHLTNPDLKK